MPLRALVTLVVLWLAIAGSAFVVLWGGTLDDVAMWIPITVACQLPSLFVIARTPGGDMLGLRDAMLVTIPATLAGASSVFLVSGLIVARPHHGLFDLRPLVIGITAAGVAIAVLFIVLWRLAAVAHPRGIRSILGVVAVIGVAAMIAITLLYRYPRGILRDYVVFAIPVIWTIPLWFATWRRPPDTVPAARAI